MRQAANIVQLCMLRNFLFVKDKKKNKNWLTKYRIFHFIFKSIFASFFTNYLEVHRVRSFLY